MHFADLASLPIDLRAFGERMRRALGSSVRIGASAPTTSQIDAYPLLVEAFEQARDFGLPMSLLVARLSNIDDLGESGAAAKAQAGARLAGAFGGETRVAALADDTFAVLLLGKDQYPDLVAALEHALERLGTLREAQAPARLRFQIGAARCPLDGDELQELIELAGRAAADLSPAAPGFLFVDRQHRLRCA